MSRCAFRVLFISRVISLLCYPCFRDLCWEITEEFLRVKNVLEPLKPPPSPARLQKPSPMADSCDTSQKKNFLFHINFPRKLSDFIIPFVKLKRTETLVEKFLSVTNISPPTLVERKVFFLFSFIFTLLDSSNHPCTPSCVKFNYSSPLYLWLVCERLQMRWVEGYHINVCITEIHIKTIS